YSFGGFVAFEMACQLRALGEDVALLVILDTAAPMGASSVANRVRARAESLREGVPPGPLSRAAVLAGRATRFRVKAARAHAERRLSFTTAGLIPRRGYAQYELFFRLHTRMAIEYQPTAIFHGPVLVIRANSSDASHDLGWSKFVSGTVSVAEVTGDHTN